MLLCECFLLRCISLAVYPAYLKAVMTPIDLHCHSNVSDGVLPPSEVVSRAAARGCQMLALTDHDELSGLRAARAEADRLGLRFINGVEISTTWRKRTLHIVGLGVALDNEELNAGLCGIRAGRTLRAQRIGEQLAAAGIGGAFEGAQRFASNPDIISRTHFARFLVEAGAAKDVKSVFKRFLVRGKPGYVSHEWAALNDAVGWIKAAGGVSVIAHPGRYEIGRGLMLELLEEYKALGGDALEVVTSNHDAEQIRRFGQLANEFGLLASCGSDFHAPGETWCEPGILPDLPYNCRPVWDCFN